MNETCTACNAALDDATTFTCAGCAKEFCSVHIHADRMPGRFMAHYVCTECVERKEIAA